MASATTKTIIISCKNEAADGINICMLCMWYPSCRLIVHAVTELFMKGVRHVGLAYHLVCKCLQVWLPILGMVTDH